MTVEDFRKWLPLFLQAAKVKQREAEREAERQLHELSDLVESAPIRTGGIRRG